MLMSILHREKLSDGTFTLRIEKLGKTRIFLKEGEVFVVPRVVAILGAQLNREFQAFHRTLCFAREAIQRGHGIDDVVGLRRGLQRTVKMHARFIPAAEIHQGNALRVVVFGRLWRGLWDLRKSYFDAAKVNARPVAKFLVRPFNNLVEDLLGALELLLLDLPKGFFVELELLLEGRVGRVRDDLAATACA
ncbi:MAG: hypothetical protein WAN13_06055 [Candidatus Acidiferrales bacterium]